MIKLPKPGEVFGDLVIASAKTGVGGDLKKSSTPYDRVLVHVKCRCGTDKMVLLRNLRAGVRSCGCSRAKKMKRVIYKGRDLVLQEACDLAGIAKTTVLHRASYTAVSAQEAFDYLAKRRENRRSQAIQHNGKLMRLVDACAEIDVRPTTVYNRMSHKQYTMQEAFDYFKAQREAGIKQKRKTYPRESYGGVFPPVGTSLL